MREQNILKDLYESKEYLTLDFFAKRYAVSTRTISNDIKYLMQLGTRYGYELKLKRSQGYYLLVHEEDKLKEMLLEDEETGSNDAKTRIHKILLQLLLHPSYITQDMLAEELQVSKSLIKLDMSKVEEKLPQHELTLDKKAHYGICLQGSLAAKKQLLMQLMEEEPYIQQVIDQKIDDELMQLIDKELITLLKQNDLTCNYTEMIKLEQYSKVMIVLHQRTARSKGSIHLGNDTYDEIAKALSKKFHRYLDITLSNEEIKDLSSYLHQKTKPTNVILEYDQQLKADIKQFLKQMDQEYDTKFLEDEQFMQSLFAHVSLLVDRLHQQISFDNPLVKEISAKYPDIFDISIKFAEMLEESYQVKATQDEIGFIATHFAAHMEKEYRNKLNSFNRIAVICSSGGGSAFLIKLKMESLFPESDIQTFSFLELDRVRNYKPDIIFTIQQLSESFEVPIVIIKELLDDEDIRKIKNTFSFCGSKHFGLDKNNVRNLFRKEAFWIISSGSYKATLQQMSEHLEAKGYAKQGFKDLVLKREEVLSTVYHNGLAIPHPIEMCSDENMLAIALIKHEMVEDSKPVKLIFMANLEKGNLKMHQNISRVLFNVMGDEKLVERIRNSESYEDFMKNISMLSF